MDNRETYNGKTPFYMTYPMQNLYLAEMEYEKDMERMKELYPNEINELQQMVERRADQMEYEGSRIYDENPDKEMLREEAQRIYEEFLRWLERQQWGQQPPPPPPPPPGRPPMQPQPGMPMQPGMQMQPGMPMQPGVPMQPGMQPGMQQGMQPGMQMPQQMPGMGEGGRFMLNPPTEWGDIMQQNFVVSETKEDSLEVAQFRGNRRCENPWLCNLTEVLFNNEIYRRRCRHRRCRRWW